MTGLTPRDHTSATLRRMDVSGSSPGNLDRDKDAEGDNYGLTAARSSDASSFKMTGAPKSPHLGRPGRQAGGRISGNLQRTRRTPDETASDIANEDKVVNELAKDRATGGRIDRAYGGHADEREDRAIVGNMVKPSAMRATGGRIGRSTGGSATATSDYTQAGRTYDNDDASGKDRITGGSYAPNHAKGGRVDRARGGRTKGKTTVNVIIGGDKQQPPAMPPPMPPPPMGARGLVGPPPGGAPMGPGGPPPPGGPPMPMRARGGRIGRQMGGAAPTPQQGFAGMGGGPPQMTPQIQAAMRAAQAAQQQQPPQMPGQGIGMAPPPGGMPAQMGGGQIPPQAQAQAQMQAMQRARQAAGPPSQGMAPCRAAARRDAGAKRPPGPMGLRTGGRVEISTPGVHNFGKPGVKHGKVDEKYGAGGGKGRMEKARRNK